MRRQRFVERLVNLPKERQLVSVRTNIKTWPVFLQKQCLFIMMMILLDDGDDDD